MAKLLEEITSGDPNKVWSSSCEIIKLRDEAELTHLARHLGEIQLATQDLELGGLLFPNSGHLAFAIRKLEFFRDEARCLCELYAEYVFFDPSKEAAAGNVVDLIPENERQDDYSCACSNCGQRFRVEEREYHYVWWRWIPI